MIENYETFEDLYKDLVKLFGKDTKGWTMKRSAGKIWKETYGDINMSKTKWIESQETPTT